MATEYDEIEYEESATQTGLKWLGRAIAIVTILVVAAFGDVMYIQLMSSKFPVGLLLVLCYIGAFTSFLAVVYMLIGKHILFTPGRQMTLAWLIFGLELTLIALNIILVFQNDGQNASGFLAFWLQLAPATPVINMAGVAVLFFLDEDGRMRHEDMEAAYESKRANRRYLKSMHRARLRLQNKQLNFLVTELDRAVSSPESLAAIQQTAIDLNTHLLGQLSGGRTYRLPAPSLPAGNVQPPEQAVPRPAVPTGPVVPSQKPGVPARAKGFLSGKQQPAPSPAPVATPAPTQAVNRANIQARRERRERLHRRRLQPGASSGTGEAGA